MMTEQVKAFADKYVERFISRKFLAWIAASTLALYGVLSSSDWTQLTMVYIGSQAAVDLVKSLKG
tara:strand:- start:12626 stop:12820 length:195 start_codon:yes stop_codon:yes gene_type:complete